MQKKFFQKILSIVSKNIYVKHLPNDGTIGTSGQTDDKFHVKYFNVLCLTVILCVFVIETQDNPINDNLLPIFFCF